ncbi:MAG TPA: hypothetical protein VMT22_17435, partial [Terriglobales bacterium]|nr:hypothetical protein [Terriglobales bacterium]
ASCPQASPFNEIYWADPFPVNHSATFRVVLNIQTIPDFAHRLKFRRVKRLLVLPGYFQHVGGFYLHLQSTLSKR